MGSAMIFDHPLIQHKISIIRDKCTNQKEFRELVNEIAMLMTYEVTRDMALKTVEIETPICMTKAKQLVNDEVTIVPILRAGLGMVDGMLKLLPNARVGHIGMYRDHDTLEPVPYYCKLPEGVANSPVIILDPMLATGGSVIAAIDHLKEAGVKDMKFMCMIASPEGIEVVSNAHPDVAIYAAALDECLNENAYIVPGLGDAGDRLFGTK